MPCTHKKTYRHLPVLSLFLTMSGCGGPDGKWLEAPNALNMAQLGAQAEAISSNSSVGDTSCKALLPKIRESVNSADPANFIFQAAIDPCTKAGMGYGEELRCNNGRLQVLCQ